MTFLQEEYDDEEEEDSKSTRFEHALEEEDPEVIKELITLIKRVGGLDELEKQLQIRLNLTQRISVDATTTMSPISKSLYNKVIGTKRGTTQQNEPLIQRQNKEQRYSVLNRNSRPAAQNEGVASLSEVEGGGIVHERPKYTTITRTQSPKAAAAVDDDEEVEGEESGGSDDDIGVAGKVDEDGDQDEGNVKGPTYQYVNIRRARPSTAAPDVDDSDDEDDETASEGVNVDPVTAATPPRMQYVNIQRVRPTKPQYYAEYIESSSSFSSSPTPPSTPVPDSR